MASEILPLQAEESEPKPNVAKTATDMVLAPTKLSERLRHFPENVYDLNPESKLVKFLKVLLGDSGAGQLRKRLLIQRMQATLQGSHFYALDRFYGPLFGLRRSVLEALDINPYIETATRDEWDAVHAKDASFRSRIEQFSRALTYGPTPTGMELIAEALLAVDVDIYESYIQADSSYQTYDELETQFAGNLLSDNATSVETDVTDWTAETNTTISQTVGAGNFPDGFSSTFGLYGHEGGQAVLDLNPAADGNISAVSDSVAVSVGTEYVFAAVAMVDATGALPGDLAAHVEIEWYDSGPSLLSTDVGSSVTIDKTLHGFGVDVTATAPASAVTAVLRVVFENADDLVGYVYFFDRMEFADTAETYVGMELESYGDLEGLGLGRLSGDDRRIFVVRPKRPISLAEANDLSRVLYNIKPADARFEVDYTGVSLYQEQTIGGAYADSEFWEIIPKVASASLPISPYQVESLDAPVEQPRPPFSEYQGEAWSYVTDLAGITASYRESTGADEKVLPTQRVTFRDGNTLDFAPQQAILPNRAVQAGRLVSDAIMVTYPYDASSSLVQYALNGATTYNDRTNNPEARLFVDGISLKSYNEVLSTLPDIDPFEQSPDYRFWATPERSMNDTTEEIIEVRMNNESLVNYVTFELAKFPHRAIVETYDSLSAEWEEVFRWEITDSTPKLLSAGNQILTGDGHPQHSAPNHWQRLRHRFDPKQTRRVRLRLRRIEGNAPKAKVRSVFGQNTPTGTTRDLKYSLAVRAFDIGYRVSDRSDFADVEGDVIAETVDLFGSTVQFEVAEKKAFRVLDDSITAWRSEPQPVNYAVVNLYLDTRDGADGTTIDRFYLDPTHSGPHLNIYYSNDPEDIDPVNDPEGFMAQRTWTPIPRDFTLQKGYLHIPPTKARYWKFEFTNLVAESYENFLALDRNVKLFPRQLVESLLPGTGQAEEALDPGMNANTSLTSPSREYRDAVEELIFAEDPNSEVYTPTEALYITDLNTKQRMAQQSWVYNFTPWHLGQQAPRFQVKGTHSYEEVTIRHYNKLAFYVGLRTLEAHRANFEANDDTLVYFDTYDDVKNIEDGFTWAFQSGAFTSEGTTPPVTFESRVFESLNPVTAIQFATEQSNAIQLVPDSEFRNPALATYDWENPDSFLRIGDAELIYSPSDYSVINIRYVVPPPKAIDRFGGLVQPIHQPVFSYREFEVADEQAAAATQGGLASPLLGLSDAGRAYAAVRFTMQTDQSSPLILEVIDTTNGDAVLASESITARKGELIEEYVAFDIPDPNTIVRIRLYQTGKSADTWKLFSMAMFDESIVWEFSVNGGGDWYTAKEIRNNDNGILSFPAAGNQLKYRATAYRENLWVSAIKIRPHYLGKGNARATGTHRGPNVSFYDQDVPIHEDPMFTSWKDPIPFYWYAANRRFPLLAVEGAPVFNEFSTFYGRPVSLDLSGSTPTISLSVDVIKVRTVEERLDLLGAPDVTPARTVTYNRSVSEAIAAPTIDASWTYVYGTESPLLGPTVRSVFSESDVPEVLRDGVLILRGHKYSGSGDWLDESGYGNHATPVGSPTHDGDSFDLTNAYLEITNDASLEFTETDEFTVVVLVSINDTHTSVQPIIDSKGSAGCTAGWLIYNGSGNAFYVMIGDQEGDRAFNSISGFVQNTRQAVALIRDPASGTSTLDAYLDGANEGDAPTDEGIDSSLASGNNVVLGGWVGGGGDSWPMRIYGVYVAPSAKTPSEIDAIVDALLIE